MEWFRNEIITGIQKLACLGLERQPAGEVLPATVAVWLEVLGSHWDQETDTPRIRAAFSTLVRTATAWPTPQKLIDALPAREELPQLPANVVSDEVAQENIRKIRAMLSEVACPVPDADDVKDE